MLVIIESMLEQASTYPGCPEYIPVLGPYLFLFFTGVFFILFTIIHYARKIWKN